MKSILKIFHPLEIFLYLIGILFSAFAKTEIVLYGAFFATVFLETKNYLKSKDFYHIIKILILSIIIPNNYLIILVISVPTVIYYKQILKCINYKVLLLLSLVLLINIAFSKFLLLNILFGLFYLVPISLIFLLLKSQEKELQKSQLKIVTLIKSIVIYELIATIVMAISNLSMLIAGVNANDWITGTFGEYQGNIFLYFMLFSLLILKKDYDLTKNKRNIIYILITVILAIATNSISLIILFILSYFTVIFLKSKSQEKLKTIALFSIILALFLLLTPAWIKSYIIKLTNPAYFRNNVAKVQVYEDTFINIPKNDLKYALIGNGIGQYSSRAALTCTGKYIDAYNRLFAPSISKYTAQYILNRYEYYNLKLGHGTLYSPFSTILTIQGEYGIIGTILFVAFIVYLMRKQDPYTKIFVLFFLFSCFIENYLEFAKIMTMVFSIYFMNKTNPSPIEKNNKKNLMFIVPTLIGGGAEKTVANLSKCLNKKYNIYIVVFHDTNEKYAYSGKLIPLSKGRNKSFIKKAIFTIKAIIKLKRLKQEKNIDYAVSFLTQADILNVLSKIDGVPTFISIRNTDSILMKSKFLKLITRISCKKCDHIVAISNQVKIDLITNFNVNTSKITVIYNPAPKISLGKTTKKTKSKDFSNITCLNVARLVEQKGQWHLIRAFSKVVQKYPNSKLIILGQGPLEKYLKGLINDYGMNSNIILMGFVNNPYDYMKQADCFIFSSLYEGLGNSILEALSCGVPIISTDCISGPREILAPSTDYKTKTKNKIDYAEYGILVPTGSAKILSSKDPLTQDEKLLAEAIIKLIKNPAQKQYYKDQAQKRSKDFDVISIKNQWISLLTQYGTNNKNIL